MVSLKVVDFCISIGSELSGPAQALANLLRLDIADFVNQVLLGGRAVGRGAAVEAAKVDVARGDVGELVSKDELLQ